MANCFYYKDGKRFDNMSDLIHEFYKDNSYLRNSAIFSSEEIQQSTINKLKTIPGINKYEAGDKGKSYEEGDALDNVGVEDVTKFIVTPHETLFRELKIETPSYRLNPEYIKENRIYHYILDKMSTVVIADDNTVSTLQYDLENLKELRKHADLDSVSDSKLIYLLSEIEKKMEIEDKTKRLGILLHNIVSLKITNKAYSNILNSFLTDPENAEIVGEASTEEWEEKIEEIADKIIEIVSKKGIPLSEMFFTSHIIKGKIDLVAVDEKGDVHIFELKMSSHRYEDWDSAKYGNLDWQLALYRQLLGQHIDVSRTQLYVIPIQIDTLGKPSSIKVENSTNRTALNAKDNKLMRGGQVYERANKILPLKVFVDYNPEREKKLKNDLNELLPGYVLQTDKEDLDVDKIIEIAKKKGE